MQVVHIDVVGAQPLQRALERLDQVVARRAHLIRAVAGAKSRLGRYYHRVASSGDRFAENFLGLPVGIDIGAVKKVKTRLQADIHQTARLVDSSRTPRREHSGAVVRCPGTQTEDRHHKPRAAKQSLFHFTYYLAQTV